MVHPYSAEDDWDDDEAALMEQMVQMGQIWRQYAIKQGKPVELLQEILDSRNKSELVELLKTFGARNISTVAGGNHNPLAPPTTPIEDTCPSCCRLADLRQ